MFKLIATALLLSAAFSAPASASDFLTSAPSSQFYAGVQAGDATTFLGGYKIDKMLAAEFTYNKYNEYASSMGLFGVASFPLTIKDVPNVSLYGRLGLARTSVEIPAINYGFFSTTAYSSSSVDLAWGGGAQYDINKRFSARVGLDFGKYKSSNFYFAGIVRF